MHVMEWRNGDLTKENTLTRVGLRDYSAVRHILKFFRRIISFIALFCWLFAAGHVASEHGGGGVHRLVAHTDQDTPHQHDLTALVDGNLVKLAEIEAMTPEWFTFFVTLAEISRESADASRLLPRQHFGADQRAYGWLFVTHSALPVRGPSRV